MIEISRALKSVTGINYILGIWAFKKDPLKAMEKFREKYGDLVYFHWPLKTLFVFHPEDIKQILVDEKNNNEKGDQAKLLTIALGDSLFIAEGEEWRKKKAVIQKVFHHQAIIGYSPIIHSITCDYITKWKKKKTINFSEEIMALSFQVSSTIFFGGIPEDQSKTIRKAFHLMGKLLAKKFASPVKIPFLIPTSDNIELKKQIKILDQFVYRIIMNARNSEVTQESFLGKLISSKDKLSDKQIRDEVVTFMGAGYETTATFITWTIYLLLKNPEQLEIFKTSAKNSNERKNILQESLRLYPSFPINVRQNILGTSLAGSKILARRNLLFSPFITQRNPRLWDRPNDFYPERFNQIDNEVLRYQFIPFLVGPKKCIGEQLAYEEAEIILETIFNNMSLRLLSLELNPLCDILLYSDTPLLCEIN